MAIVAYIAGVFLRYLYIFRWHPMAKYIYSDMLAYSNSIDNWLDPKWVPDIADTIYPPGTRYFFGVLKVLDPSLGMAMWVQLLMALAVPLLIGSLGFKLFGRRTGLYAVAIASLYFPLFDYNGYLMSEGPFIFFMLLAFWCFVSALKHVKPGNAGVFARAAGAGVFIGIAASMKSVALPAAAMVLLALAGFAWKNKLNFTRLIATGMGSLLIVLAPLSIRATRLNEGHFCMIANELSRSVLIGHCGNINHVQFDDDTRNYHFEFGCPSSIQKGYTDVVYVPHGVYENGALFAKAWEWTKAHPLQSLLLSIEHVFDLFFSSEAWPSTAVMEMRDWVQFFHEVFIVAILFPARACTCCGSGAKSRASKAAPRRRFS